MGTPDDLRAYQDAREAGDLSLRVYCLIEYHFIDQMLAAGIRTGMGDEWVRVGAMKMFCDGSISERTARLSQPYIGRPNDFGILVADEEQLYPVARKAHEAGGNSERTPTATSASTPLCGLRTPATRTAAPRSTLSPGALHCGERFVWCSGSKLWERFPCRFQPTLTITAKR